MEITRLCGHVKKRQRGKKTLFVLEVGEAEHVIAHRQGEAVLEAVVDQRITAAGIVRDKLFTIYTHAMHR